jgi:2',3'-cyclic-nucleotide 2'-phosphodiesterase (5'-nucleotidase family)
MVNLKKNTINRSYFVILLTLIIFYSCKPSKNTIYEIKGSLLPISDTLPRHAQYDSLIAPFKKHIADDLNAILTYNPVTQDKSKGKWQTNIGNFFAETTLELSNEVFNKRTSKNIDLCILNHGGIRSIIPAGNITSRTAYEIMPFENSVIVLELEAAQILEIAEYILIEKKPHPIAGLTIFLNKSEDAVLKVLVNNKEIDTNKTYFVVTSDYLANGGDNMNFFDKQIASYDLDYKLRNVFIDYFKRIDTLKNNTTQHIIIE